MGAWLFRRTNLPFYAEKLESARRVKKGSKVAVCRIIFVVSNSAVMRDYGLNLFTKSKNSISAGLTSGNILWYAMILNLRPGL